MALRREDEEAGHDPNECVRGACERRLHERINERITWKVAVWIAGLLILGIGGSFSYTTIELAKMEAHNNRESDRQSIRMEQIYSIAVTESNNKFNRIIEELQKPKVFRVEDKRRSAK